MRGFLDYPDAARTALLTVLLLAALALIALVMLVIRRKRTLGVIIDSALFLAAFALCVLLTDAHSAPQGAAVLCPSFLTACLITTALAIYAGAGIYAELRRTNRELGKGSINEALDNLPDGVCFFDRRTGRPVLCNRTMYNIVFSLTGRDLQWQTDLMSIPGAFSSDAPPVLPGDGRAFSFALWDILDEYGNAYIEATAFDVTELYNATTDLEKRTVELMRMREQLRRITENVAAITREEEILSAKMRVHNRLGSCMLLTRRYAAQDCPKEKKPELVSAWRETLTALYDEVGGAEETDACIEVIRVAKSLGAEIVVEGDMPVGGAGYMIALAMRECLTNTIKHAHGDRVKVCIEHSGQWARVSFTNNGAIPKRDIIEGGGLTSLRCSVERAGGTMRVARTPGFLLVLTLPEDKETDSI